MSTTHDRAREIVPVPQTYGDEVWPVWHLHVLPDEGLARPYDTNGCLYWKGRYHLMYIYQDPTLPYGGHCWGHASSADLVNWTFHPPALAPQPEDPDLGIFSGNAFINRDGVPMLCWFGVEAGVCVATAEDDDLIHWTRHPANPIIPMPREGEPGHGVYRVWDPYLWLEGETYYCLLGGNTLPDGKDTLYLCRSADLVTWEILHPFYEHQNSGWTVEGEDCSCPDFFALGNKHVLMCISHKVGGRCYVGEYDREHARFLPERHVRMNWPGGHFFAPESLLDLQGRRIFWAWVTDPRFITTQRQVGSGVQSMPRVLALAEDGTLRITPAEEVCALRRHPRRWEQLTLEPWKSTPLPEVAGNSLELRLEIDPREAAQVGVRVFCSPDGREETVIAYDTVRQLLTIDMTRSTVRPDVAYLDSPIAITEQVLITTPVRDRVEAPLALSPGETLTLHIFLDKPLVEVFANARQCVTQQIFPASRDSVHVMLFADGGSAQVLSLEAWELAPATFVDARDGSA
jgi:beta-fructofuranosidase